MTEPKRRAPAADETISSHLPPPRRASLAAVGLFVILGAAATLVVLFTMTEPSTFRGRHTMHTIVEDAGGVRRGDPVQMRGVNVGRVQSFRLLEEEGLVRIDLELERRWAVPRGSFVEVGDPGIFGGRTIIIRPGEGPGVQAGGDLLPVAAEAGGGIFGSIEAMSENASDFLERVNEVLDTTTVGALQASARELEAFLASTADAIRSTSAEVEAMSASVRAAADSAAAAGGALAPDVEGVLARADSAIASLDRAAAGIDEVLVPLRSILAKVDGGEGTLGMLVNDSDLYDNANATLLAVAELIADFRENPKKYIDVSIF